MRYDLKILSNGLAICSIKVINPFNDKEHFQCKALIDSGADCTILCTSIFEKFTIAKSHLKKMGFSTLNNDEPDITICPLRFKVPSKNIFEITCYTAIRDLSKRSEYDAIIGTNILKEFDFIYKGVEKIAWLEC